MGIKIHWKAHDNTPLLHDCFFRGSKYKQSSYNNRWEHGDMSLETWWVLKSLIHKLLTYWLKLVPLKCGSSRKFPLEVLVNVRGLIMVWIDCKDTSVISTSRQTLLRRPLQLALTKICSSVQPLQEEEITSTLLGLKCVRWQHKRTSILKWPITDTFRCFRNFKAQITACLTDLHQHINTVEKIF